MNLRTWIAKKARRRRDDTRQQRRRQGDGGSQLTACSLLRLDRSLGLSLSKFGGTEGGLGRQ
jgi:hypothetical protein